MQSNNELEAELSFLEAQRRFKQARESGDPEAIREAEDAWRAMVRGELLSKEGCAE